MKRRYRLAPHQPLINNPLFALDVRRIRWGQSEQLLLRYSARRITIICCALLIVWLVVSLRDLQRYTIGDFALFLFALSFLASLALDYTSISAALGSINGEMTAGRWDLLRLSLVTVPQIVAAKHGAAQVRAWRLMVVIIALRVAVLLMVSISLLPALIHTSAFAYVSAAQLPNAFVELIVLIALGLLYIIEPWWRMRTVTALGVAISARARQHVSAVLAAGGTVFAIWLLQGVIAFVIMLVISFFVFPLALVEYSAYQFVIVSPLAASVLITAAVYGFYSIVQTWGLRRAELWIAQASR